MKWSVATIALFSANAMEAIIRFLQVCCHQTDKYNFDRNDCYVCKLDFDKSCVLFLLTKSTLVSVGFQKLNAGLTRPRRQGQLTASQNGTLVFATAQPLLLLVKTMLSKLFDTSAEVCFSA